MGRCIMCTGIRLLLLIHPLISSFFFSPIFNIEILGHTFLGNCEVQKIETWYTHGQWAVYHVYQNQASAAYLSLYFFIFLSIQFSTLKFFVTLFSGTMRPRRLVHLWTVGRCIMYTRFRLLLLIHPFISSFFFLSNFQH